MSEEKAEALRQINEIKNHLVDKQTFFPYNFRATYVWSIIAFVLTFSMIPMYEKSIVQGTLFMSTLIIVGFIIEGVLTKKVNKSYDIEDCTNRQRFIMHNFLMLSLFLIILSTVLASYKLYIPIYLSWLFLVSLGFFAVGFVLNIERFTKMSQFNMLCASILLAVAYMNDTIEGNTDTFFIVVQIFLVLGLTVMPAIVAWQQIKEEK